MLPTIPFHGHRAARSGPSRSKIAALAGVGVVAAAGAWFSFGHSSTHATGAAPAMPIPTKPAVAVSAAPAAPVLPPLAKAPTQGLDLGGSPKLSVVVPKIALFVEESRGHRFKNKVPVTPLADKAFVAALRKADGSGRADPNAAASPKALHLLPVGLNTGSGRVPDSAYAGIVGFYDFRTKSLYVRGTTLNPLTQSIVAHELTHALDDQYFNLAHVQKLGRNSDQAEAILSLIEGDARSVENNFSQALVPGRQAQEDAERAAYLAHAAQGAGVSDVPDPFVLELDALFPYELGSTFVGALHDQGGSATVDAAFAKPPTSTLQILDPDGHFVQRIDAVTVAAPTYPKSPGTKVIDRDSLGSLGLASVLAEGHPIDWNSEEVVSGWAGDSYVTTRAGATTCVRDNIKATSAKTAVALDKALTAWAGHHAGASVKATSKTGLLLVSCVG
ncbi:MAG: hypothetical protein QOE76_4099 [Frankiales bacterium]|nr:hypothetical protein [Frankiales bacterium]